MQGVENVKVGGRISLDEYLKMRFSLENNSGVAGGDGS